MPNAKISIVVVPRDHFSDTRESLESIYENTSQAFDLVYVDGGSPKPIARYLQQQSGTRGFRLIRSDHYLSPNRARNLGARSLTTPYIVFVDNDVVVAPDWLTPLVECAEATGAAVVGPLTFEKRPLHTIVHFAGGEAHVESTIVEGAGERHLIDRISKKVPPGPVPTEVAEFHCMLVRAKVLSDVGGLDARMLSTRENLDFCMAVREQGGTVYCDPRSKVTYLPPEKMAFSDMGFFALRWSDEWDMSSFRDFRDKWNLIEDSYFLRQYENLGWRRRGFLMRSGLLRWLGSWRLRIAAERALRPLERRVNRWLSGRYAREQGFPPDRGREGSETRRTGVM